MARLLLLVPARTYRASDFILAANRMGVDLVVGSEGALSLGEHPVVRVDLKDLDGSVNRLVDSDAQLDAVLAIDTEMLVLAATSAARLGLPHNAVEAVMAASDKAEQRRRWAAVGIRQPAFRVVPTRAAEGAVKIAAAEVGFPCLVKAVSLSGSRGVLLANDDAAAEAAAVRIRELLTEPGQADEPLLVEEYVPGLELSIDGFLVDDALTVTAVFDKPDTPEGPTFEETLLVTPSRLPERILSSTLRTAEQAALALGLRYGPIHAELRIDARGGGDRPTMLELAARSIGGLCSRALRFLDGVSLEEMVIANALGRHVKPPSLGQSAGVLMLPVERSGVLMAVEGQTEAAAVPGITGLSITIPMGEVVRPLPEGDRYLGFIFAEGDTPENVAATLRTARSCLTMVIECSEKLATYRS